MRKKSPLKNSTKKLLRKSMNRCEKSMKEAVRRRDKKCQVCGSTRRLQVDHFISRRNKATYYDINNLTLLCSRCHYFKSFGYQDYDMKVADVVFLREGVDVVDELRKKARTIKKWEISELETLIETYDKLCRQ